MLAGRCSPSRWTPRCLHRGPVLLSQPEPEPRHLVVGSLLARPPVGPLIVFCSQFERDTLCVDGPRLSDARSLSLSAAPPHTVGERIAECSPAHSCAARGTALLSGCIPHPSRPSPTPSRGPRGQPLCFSTVPWPIPGWCVQWLSPGGGGGEAPRWSSRYLNAFNLRPGC